MKAVVSVVGRWGAVLWRCLGVPADSTSHLEKLISGVGAGMGILCVYGALCLYAFDQALVLLTASVAASSVLVFAVPHGVLSQPWPVVGSYVLSGLVGVTCQRWVDVQVVSAVLAVALAVLVMYYGRCLHPPGGAVALLAVIGGPEIQALGYGFVVVPALLSAATLVCAAIVYNSVFPWRRYPLQMLHLRPHRHPLIREHHLLELAPEDYRYALEQQDSFMDISPDDLAELVESAREHALLARR